MIRASSPQLSPAASFQILGTGSWKKIPRRPSSSSRSFSRNECWRSVTGSAVFGDPFPGARAVSGQIDASRESRDGIFGSRGRILRDIGDAVPLERRQIDRGACPAVERSARKPRLPVERPVPEILAVEIEADGQTFGVVGEPIEALARIAR